MAVLGQPVRERLGRLDAVVAHGDGEDAGLDPEVAPRVVDAGGDAAEVLLVGHPDGVGVAGGGAELDVEAVLGARSDARYS